MGKPRLFCDFNNQIEDGLYFLTPKSLADDLFKLGLTLKSLKKGREVVFYMEDPDEEGKDCLLLAEGTIQYDRKWKWVARINENTFRARACSARCMTMASRAWRKRITRPWVKPMRPSIPWACRRGFPIPPRSRHSPAPGEIPAISR